MPYKNKEKNLQARRNWYQKNKEKEIAYKAERRKKLKKWWNAYRATLKCNRCPENHIACLEFHHKNQSKKNMRVSEMISAGFSIENVMKEIKKCEVLCANCHRKEHWKKKALIV